ncbi:hypothetical protein [Sphingomonas baiyangensis]|uniref:Uncharacterized protein n=1 Tax=Sphingomonas baiyangensis TaxID=2572576 RepID=A0A4U1L1D3_9SPHN|nr:hypothetical protein [Sphingomonas baiyangensis]TKD49960.1 hypothetical protein FBR43_03680 [Sphingomonas baiyangensis]
MPLSLLLLPLLIEPPAPTAQERAPAPGTQTVRRTVRIRQHIVVRVPRLSLASRPIAASTAAPLPPISWTEQKAEDCVPLDTLAGAAITRPDSVDLLMVNGRRMRARLGPECQSMGFYGGLYLRPTADGRLCVHRDRMRSRSGGECSIEQFHTLVPAR